MVKIEIEDRGTKRALQRGYQGIYRRRIDGRFHRYLPYRRGSSKMLGVDSEDIGGSFASIPKNAEQSPSTSSSLSEHDLMLTSKPQLLFSGDDDSFLGGAYRHFIPAVVSS
jgi:hypothetical protein